MKPIVYKFKVGDRVYLNSEERIIERIGRNINQQPIYKIGELWHHERELTEWYPPCPV